MPRRRSPAESTDPRKFRGVSFRTDPALELELDRLALALSEPGRRVTRATAAKRAFVAGLEALAGRPAPEGASHD